MFRFSVLTASVVLPLLGSAHIRPASAQTHFTDCLAITGNSATLIIPAAIEPRIDEAPIQPGDEVAAYTEDGVCAGVAAWSGSNMSLTIWGDDVVTADDDGFAPDETIAYRVWDASEDREGSAVSVSYSSSQPFYRTTGTYRENAIYALASFEATTDDQPVPSAPTLVAPEDQAVDVQTTVTLEWTPVDGALSYEVQVSEDTSYATLVVEAKDLHETTHLVSDLEKGTAYHWRVRAVNEGGVGEYSEVFLFTTGEDSTVANDAPEFTTSPPRSVFAGETFTYEVATSDSEGHEISLVAVSAPAWLSFESTGATGRLTGTPTDAHLGGYTVTLRAIDELSATRDQTFSITVRRVGSTNESPAVAEVVPAQTATLGAPPVSIDLSGTFHDADGDLLEFSASSGSPAVLETSVSGSTVQLIPRGRGQATVIVEARDVEGALATTTFDVTVTGNQPPIARADMLSTGEDEVRVLEVRDNDEDPDGDDLSIHIVMNPSNGTVSVSDAGIAYTPALDYFGSDTFVYRVEDGYGGKASAVVYVEVSPLNDPPRFPKSDAIVEPIDGAVIYIDANAGGQALSVAWTDAVDPEGDDAHYGWELSATSTFDEILISVVRGTDTAVSLDHAEIDAALAAAGVAEGVEVTLYHRATTTDGVSVGASEPRSVRVVRGTGVGAARETPTSFALLQNYPNPFNPQTRIDFSLESPGEVELALYDALGRKVDVLLAGHRSAGTHSVTLEASALPSGLYVYRLVSGERTAVRTALLVR